MLVWRVFHIEVIVRWAPSEKSFPKNEPLLTRCAVREAQHSLKWCVVLGLMKWKDAETQPNSKYTKRKTMFQMFFLLPTYSLSWKCINILWLLICRGWNERWKLYSCTTESYMHELLQVSRMAGVAMRAWSVLYVRKLRWGWMGLLNGGKCNWKIV